MNSRKAFLCVRYYHFQPINDRSANRSNAIHELSETDSRAQISHPFLGGNLQCIIFITTVLYISVDHYFPRFRFFPFAPLPSGLSSPRRALNV